MSASAGPSHEREDETEASILAEWDKAHDSFQKRPIGMVWYAALHSAVIAVI